MQWITVLFTICLLLTNNDCPRKSCQFSVQNNCAVSTSSYQLATRPDLVHNNNNGMGSTVYTRDQLFCHRDTGKPPSPDLLRRLKQHGIAQNISHAPASRGARRKYRGGAGCRRPIPIGGLKKDQSVQGRRTSGPGVNLANLRKIELCGSDAPSTRAQRLLFCSFNAQSVRNKIDIIQDLIVGEDLDVVAVQEHWLSQHERDDFYNKALPPDGYSLHRVSRLKGYGGVALIFRSSLKILSTHSVPGLCFENTQVVFQSGSLSLNVIH